MGDDEAGEIEEGSFLPGEDAGDPLSGDEAFVKEPDPLTDGDDVGESEPGAEEEGDGEEDGPAGKEDRPPGPPLESNDEAEPEEKVPGILPFGEAGEGQAPAPANKEKDGRDG